MNESYKGQGTFWEGPYISMSLQLNTEYFTINKEGIILLEIMDEIAR